MTATSSVSVLIPTYNYARFLPQAIESVLAQSVSLLEIVVADDGSTDGTEQVVARYKDQVAYLRFEHRGIVALRNEMFPRLRGEWILNLDADDWIEPTFLEAALARVGQLGNPPELAFLYADRADFGAYERRQTVPEFSAARLKQGNYIPFDMLVRRDVAVRYAFDAAFAKGWEDYDYLIALVKNGYVGARLASPPVHCRVHSDNRTGRTLGGDELQTLMKQIVAKHADFFSPEEARAAVEGFSPESVLRGRICECIRARQYLRGTGLLLQAGFRRPGALLSPDALRRVGTEIVRTIWRQG